LTFIEKILTKKIENCKILLKTINVFENVFAIIFFTTFLLSRMASQLIST